MSEPPERRNPAYPKTTNMESSPSWPSPTNSNVGPCEGAVRPAVGVDPGVDDPEIQWHDSAGMTPGRASREDVLRGDPSSVPDPQSSIAESLLGGSASLLGDKEPRKEDGRGRITNLEEETLGEALLPPDSFSILATAPVRSRPFFLAFAAFAVQLTTLILVLIDSLPRVEAGEVATLGGNYFGFPVDVPKTVRIAEYVAILISVFMQDDLVQGLHLINEGHDRVGKGFEHASKLKWGFHIILRLVEGSLGLVVTFILIMQQVSVLELLLNFTALEFVASFDDVAFKLFELGFFGARVQEEAKEVAETKCLKDDGAEKRHRLVRPILLGFVSVSFVTALGLIQNHQHSGDYLRLIYTECQAARPILIGDGYCDKQYNTIDCGWDGGDCVVDGYPKCHVDEPKRVGDGECDKQYKTLECGWDGGDCERLFLQYPNCNVDFLGSIGDGRCDGGEYNTEECGWDGGDCTVDGYPNCHVDIPNYVGNGVCGNLEYNTEECGWDGGDCKEFNEKYPDCNVACPECVGNMICAGGAYNTAECGWDGGDCEDFNKFPDCNISRPGWIGNGFCQGGEFNTPECGWDGGDCDEFNEKYPDCNVIRPEWIGDGDCDFRNNILECGWDGGDCDAFNEKYPGCNVERHELLGNGHCDGGEYDTLECQWDGGDCTEFSRKFPDCKVELDILLGSGFCDDAEYNNVDCGWDGGDCLKFNEKYPDCVAFFPWKIGNGVCDGGEYNTKDCGWDGGDCKVDGYPECHVNEPKLVGNDECDGGEYNTEECGMDGGDCV